MTYSVLLVNSWRVINAKGGTEKVFCNLANALSRRGFSVALLCCDPNHGNPGFDVDPEVEFLNVGEEENLCERLFGKIRSFSFSSCTRKKKRGALRVERFARLFGKARKAFETADVIISFQPETTYVLKKKLNVTRPVISMFHHDPCQYFQDPLFYSAYREALSECEVIQVLRPEYVNELYGIAKRTVCIPNASPRYLPQRDLSVRKIITVGRVNLKQKRTDLLVKSFSLIKERFPDWVVEIWGELDLNFQDTQYIRRLIDDLDLKDRIVLKGTTEDIEAVYRSCSVFAFPSAYEGFSLSLIEAMMVGIPPVGCVDCSGVNTLIKNGVNGILTKPTPEAFAKGLMELMMDEEKRTAYGSEARKSAEYYDPEKVWDAWQNLICDVVHHFPSLR